MELIHGNRDKITLGSSMFSVFIEKDYLYVDKTRFIENVIDSVQTVLLIPRPRRTGKTLNLDTLRTFLDCKEKSRALFSGLYIETTPVMAEINKYPVIYLDFKDLRIEDYKQEFKSKLRGIAKKYLTEEQVSYDISDFLNNKDNFTTSALLHLTTNIYEVYGVKPYILIDEYDSLIMDNMGTEEGEEMRKWLSYVLESALKNNRALEKAVLTGITRVSQEGFFSKLNNVTVYDIFTPSVFDDNFSLTEAELTELVPDGQIAIRHWYNNMRVGDARLYNLYSVLSYLLSPKKELKCYWGQSGIMDFFIRLMTTKRLESLLWLLNDRNNKLPVSIEPRIVLQYLKNRDSDKDFYSMAIQAGYLTYDVVSRQDGEMLCDVYVPNFELIYVWKNFILDNCLKTTGPDLRDIMKEISRLETFSAALTNFITDRLSFYDFDSREPEKTYHVYVLAMFAAAGYQSASNREAGSGRYDVAVQGADQNVVIEFKKASGPEKLTDAADAALRQIDEKQYCAPFEKMGKPIYKIGIGFCGKRCFAKTAAR
jgi:hypothetical protein